MTFWDFKSSVLTQRLHILGCMKFWPVFVYTFICLCNFKSSVLTQRLHFLEWMKLWPVLLYTFICLCKILFYALSFSQVAVLIVVCYANILSINDSVMCEREKLVNLKLQFFPLLTISISAAAATLQTCWQLNITMTSMMPDLLVVKETASRTSSPGPTAFLQK